MTRSSLQKALVAIAVAAIVPTMTACPKKPPPAVADAEPPPVVVDAAPNVLEPLVDDAGVDAADAAHHAGGNWKPQDPIVQRLSQCCAALAKQAKDNGNPPELASAVLTCNSTAAQLKSNPNAPELNVLRPFLKNVKNLPALCAGI
jgi:hypothetical protein